MSLSWCLPFLGLLLSMAVCQAAAPAWWSRYYGWVTALWIAAALLPMAALMPIPVATRMLRQTLLSSYLPFLVTMAALYAIVGGIRIRTRMSGHPLENTLLLGLGTLFAGVGGTLGATLLFLPVLLTANQWRRHRRHTMVFLIFLLCNIGGGMTPLSPPLLLGYLSGVPFLWMVQAMLAPTLFVAGILLGVYYGLDAVYFFPHEDGAARAAHRRDHDSLTIEGGVNLLLLAAAIALQVLCGDSGELPRLAGLAVLAAAAMRRGRAAHHFGWRPLAEVAVLFAGIFLTIGPCLAILAEGRDAALGGLFRLLAGIDGRPLPWAYFTITGLLSAFLDNAPTFLVFFNAAGGDPARLIADDPTTLTAIATGATFWGGATYIGNAPNFLVLSVAERHGVAMPHFFGFLAWSGVLLLPVLGLAGWVFFR